MSQTIKGVWKFNTTISPMDDDFTQVLEFNYTLLGAGHNSITIDKVWDESVNLIFAYDDITSTVYDELNLGGWASEDYRWITVAYPQTVSDEFYTWLTANAEQYSYINGKWEFRFETSETEWPMLESEDYLDVFVNFSCNGDTYNKITFNPPEIADGKISFSYRNDSLIERLVYDASWGDDRWVDEAYRTIDFGTEMQLVPERFYTWMESGAYFRSTLIGVWTITAEKLEPIDDTWYVPFKSNGKTYSSFVYDGSGAEAILRYDNDAVYNFTQSKWIVGDKYKTINFGVSSLTPYYSLYKWIHMHAEQCTVLEGNWRLNDIVSGTGVEGAAVSASLHHLYYADGEVTERVDFTINADATSVTIADGFYTIADRRISIGTGEYAVTVSPEFYAWFYENASTSRAISGWYQFNTELDVPVSLAFTQSFRFYGYAFGYGMAYVPATIKVDDGYIEFAAGGYAATEASFAQTVLHDRMIGFGNAQQQVAFEFYDWLLSNAVAKAEVAGTWRLDTRLSLPSPTVIQDTDTVLSGTWIIDSAKLSDLLACSSRTDTVSETVIFRVGTDSMSEDAQRIYHQIRFNFGSKLFIYYIDELMAGYSPESGWDGELNTVSEDGVTKHGEIITFTEEQTVSASFYALFTSIATPETEIDTETEVETVINQRVNLYGTYRFGDTWVADPSLYDTYVKVTSSSISIVADGVGESFIYDGSKYDFTCLSNRELNFGEDMQVVSIEFFDWLYANADYEEFLPDIPTGDIDPDMYTIAGETLRSIADSIRGKTGKTEEIFVSDYASEIDSIAIDENSAVPIEVSTEVEMTALLTSGEVGGVYRYVGTTGTYENGALYLLTDPGTADTILSGTWIIDSDELYNLLLEDRDNAAQSLNFSAGVKSSDAGLIYYTSMTFDFGTKALQYSGDDGTNSFSNYNHSAYGDGWKEYPDGVNGATINIDEEQAVSADFYLLFTSIAAKESD